MFAYLEALLFAELAVVVVVLLLELADAVVMDDAVAPAVSEEEVLFSVAVDEPIVDDPSAAGAASAFGLSKRSMTALALDNIDLAKLSLTNIPNKRLMHKL